ncbi:MAG: hypothetical protein HONDAALG_03771 [Gammaproteobacteria bacterium]|nr:hypothetical protein [Gammaproteobacteria bacterium]
MTEKEPDWKHAICPVCNKGFTAKSWEKRHTWLIDHESDVHERCCRCMGMHDDAAEAGS